MAFSVKDWRDATSSTGGGDTSTPLSAAALEDLETRLSNYTDSVAGATVELGYAEITASFTQTGVGNSDVTGLSTAVTVGTRPIMVLFECSQVQNSGAGLTHVRIMEGATILQVGVMSASTTSQSMSRSVRLTPTTGSHTYKINLRQVLAANSTLNADAAAAGAYGPTFIQVLQV